MEGIKHKKIYLLVLITIISTQRMLKELNLKKKVFLFSSIVFTSTVILHEYFAFWYLFVHGKDYMISNIFPFFETVRIRRN